MTQKKEKLRNSSLSLYPFFIGFIRRYFGDLHNTRNLIFMERLYCFFEFFIVFFSSFVERDDLFTMGKRSLPPVGTLYRKIIRTGDNMLLQKFRSDTNCFRFGWMCHIDKEERHIYIFRDSCSFLSLSFWSFLISCQSQLLEPSRFSRSENFIQHRSNTFSFDIFPSASRLSRKQI